MGGNNISHAVKIQFEVDAKDALATLKKMNEEAEKLLRTLKEIEAIKPKEG